MIGFFDSGSGGLTVLSAAAREFPDRHFVYLGDHAFSPYGDKDPDYIYDRARKCVSQLADFGCSTVVLACNTASIYALPRLRYEPQHWDPKLQLIDIVEPVVANTAGLMPHRKRIVVFASPKTAESNAYSERLNNLLPSADVIQVPCEGLVQAIEEGKKGSFIRALIRNYMKDFVPVDFDPDTAILACTHFPLVKTAFQDVLPRSCRIVDQAKLVTQTLANLLRGDEGLSAETFPDRSILTEKHLKVLNVQYSPRNAIILTNGTTRAMARLNYYNFYQAQSASSQTPIISEMEQYYGELNSSRSRYLKMFKYDDAVSSIDAWVTIIETQGSVPLGGLRKAGSLCHKALQILEHNRSATRDEFSYSAKAYDKAHRICQRLLFGKVIPNILAEYYLNKHFLSEIKIHESIDPLIRNAGLISWNRHAWQDVAFEHPLSATTLIERAIDTRNKLAEAIDDPNLTAQRPEIKASIESLDNLSDPKIVEDVLFNAEKVLLCSALACAERLKGDPGLRKIVISHQTTNSESWFHYKLRNEPNPHSVGRSLTVRALSSRMGLVESLLDFDPPRFTVPNCYTYGNEFEVYVPSNKRIINAIEYLLSTTGLDWRQSPDGSLEKLPKYKGLEIVSPPLEADTVHHMTYAAFVLNILGCQVGKPTAFHFHVGYWGDKLHEEETLALSKSVIKNYAKCQEDLFFIDAGLTHSYPNCTEWEQRIEAAENLPELIQIAQPKGRRRAAVNLYSLLERGTFEFRQHPGTVDSDKARAWPEFCAGLVSLSAAQVLGTESRSELLLARVQKLYCDGQYDVRPALTYILESPDYRPPPRAINILGANL